MTKTGLAAQLHEATRTNHRRAEQSGIMRRLLQGSVDRSDYCRLLRNLHAIYLALERALDRHAESPMVAPVRVPDLYRAQALAADLDHLHGSGWQALPVAAAASAYVSRIDGLAAEWPAGLVAHAYVRYLGDLSGGQTLRAIVGESLNLEDGRGAAFYAFGGPRDADALKRQYRAGIDSLPIEAANREAIVAEANTAFARHVQLFEELDATRAQH